MSQRKFFSRILFASILFSSITPLFGMEEVPFDVNNGNNVPPKDKEEADEEIEVQDPANAQARAFHRRLVELHPEWFGDNVQSYYKRIDPITSRPPAGRGGWYPHNVSIGGRPIMPNEQGAYIHDGISFNPNDCIPNFWQNFDPNKEDFTIPISYNNQLVEVVFMEASREKILALPRLENYNACLAMAGGDQFSFIRKITLRGILNGENGHSHMIEIEVKRDQEEAIILQGMELIFNKNMRTTQILFDFVDTAHEPVDLMHPIECRHSNEVADNSVFCIKEHKVYNCSGKAIHSFFDSPATRERWVSQGSLFYDQNNRGLVTLPSRYADPNDRQERATDPLAWVLGEGNNSLYQLQELELKNTNDYIYCDNNLFYALLFYQSIWRDYLSPDPNNRVRFDYLLQVKKPNFRINANARPVGTHRPWANGLYKCMLRDNKNYWQHINNPVSDSIDFRNRPTVQVLWPAEPLNAQEMIQWGDAGQRFFPIFHANIRHCNQALSDKLSTWNKLNCIDLSKVKLADDIAWDRLFTAIGTLRQLTQLDFSYNYPVDFMDNQFIETCNKVHVYYVSLATCLSKLTNLKKLSIHGLWLKPHTQLDWGCPNENCISIEVARLLGINWGGSNGIRYLITILSRLTQLENLSIDAIPNHGSSEWDRAYDSHKLIGLAWWIIFSPLTYIDAKKQDIALKQLVYNGADSLAQKPSLRTISVYSPGGNCVNYFSKAFRDRLAASRATAQAANPNLPQLTINAEVLK